MPHVIQHPSPGVTRFRALDGGGAPLVLQGQKAQLYGVSFVVGPEAADAIAVAVTVTGVVSGVTVAQRIPLFVYLSADANGDAIQATAFDTTATAVSGTIVDEHVTKKAWEVITSSGGGMLWTFSDSGDVDPAYLVVVTPDGLLHVSDAIDFA